MWSWKGEVLNSREDIVVDPHSVISPKAQLGADCEIGPYCKIGEDVVLGSKCKLHSHVVLDGDLVVGDNCEFYPFSCIGMQTQDLKYKGERTRVTIGSNNVFREYVTVNAATSSANHTSVGNGCLIQSYCHIAHECQLGNHVIMSSGAMLSGHVEVDDYAVIGGYVGVVQFVKIGTMAMVGGYSKLAQDVLPYCIAEGVPAELRSINKIGMERNGKSPQEIRIVIKAFKQIIRSGLPLENVASDLSTEYPDSLEIKQILDFISRSDRGLARPRLNKDRT